MPQQQLLTRVVAVLDRLGIEYMVTGSHVSSFQGAPRSTHDVDIVVQIPPSAATALATAFPPPNYYLDQQSIDEAIRTKTHFNLLDASEGDKVDFWLLTDAPFDQSRFSRRLREDIGHITVPISRIEDTIIQKLKWCTEGGFFSEKQFRDVMRVYEMQRTTLDMAYTQHWVFELGLDKVWEKLIGESKPLE